MAEKKFTRSYFSLPDKQHQIDIAIGLNYRNIDILFDGTNVATFSDTDELNKAGEIVTPKNHLISVKFLKDSSDFEVVLDGVQIDDSPTSPKKVIAQVRIPIIMAFVWYSVVLLLSGKAGVNVPAMVAMSPTMLFTHPVVIFLMTSTIVVLMILVVGYIKINQGSLAFYKIVAGLLLVDLIYGIIYYLMIMGIVGEDLKTMVLLELFVPFAMKTGILLIMYKNWPKFKRFSFMLDKQRRSIRPDLVDNL